MSETQTHNLDPQPMDEPINDEQLSLRARFDLWRADLSELDAENLEREPNFYHNLGRTVLDRTVHIEEDHRSRNRRPRPLEDHTVRRPHGPLERVAQRIADRRVRRIERTQADYRQARVAFGSDFGLGEVRTLGNLRVRQQKNADIRRAREQFDSGAINRQTYLSRVQEARHSHEPVKAERKTHRQRSREKLLADAVGIAFEARDNSLRAQKKRNKADRLRNRHTNT